VVFFSSCPRGHLYLYLIKNLYPLNWFKLNPHGGSIRFTMGHITLGPQVGKDHGIKR
jgi:hypothetical protein